MRNKKRIEVLEERVSELETLLDEMDERLSALTEQRNERGGAKTEGITTSRLLNEWLNGEEKVHE